MVGPADQREVVGLLVTEEGCNVSRACAMAAISRSTYRYKHKQKDDRKIEGHLSILTSRKLPFYHSIKFLSCSPIDGRRIIFINLGIYPQNGY